MAPNVRTRFRPYPLASNTSAKPNSCSRSHSRSRAFVSNTRTLKQIDTKQSSTHLYTTLTPKPNIHAVASSNALVKARTHNQTYNSSQLHTPSQSLRVTISNTDQPNTNTITETASVLEEPQNKISKQEAPKTKIITLNNKYVPKGVQLAIAVEHNKKLSKNALKKITRNLAGQL